MKNNWTEEFENMIVEDECPRCSWYPDCDDCIIAYSPQRYSHSLSMLSSFPQYTWTEIYDCPECSTKFKMGAESC
jgi:hypothetical protein